MNRKLISIASGKGGVGKSFVVVNLGYTLARLGYKTLIVDLDYGSANLHSYISVDRFSYSLSDYLARRVANLEQVVSATNYKNLSFINGANDDLDVHTISESKTRDVILDLKAISNQYDYVIADLGAGNHNCFLDVFIAADFSLLVGTPEVSSTENLIRFVKATFFRVFHQAERRGLGIGMELKRLRQSSGTRLAKTYLEILNLIERNNPLLARNMKLERDQLRLGLILNSVQGPGELAVASQVTGEIQHTFGMEVSFLGEIFHDSHARMAMQEGVPLSSKELETRRYFKSIADQFISVFDSNLGEYGTKTI